MEHKTVELKIKNQLPTTLVGPIDVLKLRREVETLDEFMRQADLRKPGTAQSLPRVSKNLTEISEANKLNLLHDKDRRLLIDFLENLRLHAPVVHISFASDPSGAFLSKIISWFRQNVDPLVLLQVGLQPNIAAGAIVRTTNHIFDFNLQKHFADKRQVLIDKLNEGSSEDEQQ